MLWGIGLTLFLIAALAIACAMVGGSWAARPPGADDLGRPPAREPAAGQCGHCGVCFLPVTWLPHDGKWQWCDEPILGVEGRFLFRPHRCGWEMDDYSEISTTDLAEFITPSFRSNGHE